MIFSGCTVELIPVSIDGEVSLGLKEAEDGKEVLDDGNNIAEDISGEYVEQLKEADDRKGFAEDGKGLVEDGEKFTKDADMVGEDTETVENIKISKREISNMKNGDISLICSVCGKSFPSRKKFQVHFYQYHPQTSSDYFCNLCGKTFAHLFLLNKHIRRIHEANYKCDICMKKFKTNQHLMRHIHSIHKKD